MSQRAEYLDLSGRSDARRGLALLADGPDEAIDLALGALLIAAEDLEDEVLVVEGYLEELDRLASRVLQRVTAGANPVDRVRALHEVLFREAGFAGDTWVFDRLDGALLPRVMERRRGLPVSLAVVVVEVARRAGVDAAGVAFPGRFLVRCEVDEGFVVLDPFREGRILDREDCEILLDDLTGGQVPFHPSLLDPSPSRTILVRILANLRQMHLRAGDLARALRAQDRVVLLEPRDPKVLRERAELRRRLGAVEDATGDLEGALELAPFGPESQRIRAALERLAGGVGPWKN